MIRSRFFDIKVCDRPFLKFVLIWSSLKVKCNYFAVTTVLIYSVGSKLIKFNFGSSFSLLALRNSVNMNLMTSCYTWILTLRKISSICVLIVSVATIVLSRDEGIPGVDYPAYSEVPPRLQFSCKDRLGYFADPETNCQVWHWCVEGGFKYSFLCPNATVFNQKYRVCDWWYNVDCTLSQNLYNVNEDLYKDEDGNYI